MQVRVANGFEKTQAANILRRDWGEPVIARGRTYMSDDCEIYLAGDMEGIAAVSHDGPPFMELVAINAFSQWKGVGSALIEAIAASASAIGFEAIRLTTTNDNVDGLRFYQRRGFQLTALRPGAVDESRRLKPTISANRQHGIPTHDELDLVRRLRRGEFSAALELRRLFPAITDNAQARACARTIAGWKPLPVPLRPVPRVRPRRRDPTPPPA